MSTRALALAFALACLLTGPCHALDIEQAIAPWKIPDNELTIGSRTLRLGSGAWLLVQRGVFQAGRISTRQGGKTLETDVLNPMAIQVEGGQFRIGVILSLPLKDFQDMESWGDDSCKPNNGALHSSASRDLSGQECLAIFGHEQMIHSFLKDAPAAAKWLLDNRVVGLESAIEIVYTHRLNATFGRVHVYVPASYFESDDAMMAWAGALRQAVKPMFEGKTGEAGLPAPPSLSVSIQANDAVSSMLEPADPADSGEDAVARNLWVDCLTKEGAHLDDGLTPASEVAAAILFRCRDLELRGVMATVAKTHLGELSRSEANAIFEGAHRQISDSGLATAIVLDHRAARAAKH